MSRPGELSPHSIHPGVFEVKYETKAGLFNSLVRTTIEIHCSEEENFMSVILHQNAKKKQNEPITFPLNSEARGIYLISYEPNSNNLSTLTKFRIAGLNKNMGPFQCGSIVQLHRLLASIEQGNCNTILFSQGDADSLDPLTWQVVSRELPYDHQDTLHKVTKARIAFTPIKRHRSLPSTPPPTYIEAIKRFPMAYYRPEDINTYHTVSISTAPALSRNVEMSSARSQHDVFLPPYGPPMSYPISLGYGLEVGLDENTQELFDPADNSLFYLNHRTNKFYIDDPRPPRDMAAYLPFQIIKPREEAHFNYIPSLLFDDVTASLLHAEQMATLALERWERHSGYQVNVGGEYGEHGINGIPGQKGFFGCCGADGRFYGGPGHQGQDGKSGSNGSNGLSATDGTAGGDLYINLSGSSERLVLSGEVVDQLEMGGSNSQSILFINAAGGKGGKGGRGGIGGKGGKGGMGGHGHKGIVGIDAMIPGGAGGAGQSGGFGGRGGNGGDGGNGGNGGNGGRGGKGGRVIITCQNPALFALIEINSMGGKGGRGGLGGKGGERGEGGKGGGGGDAGRGGMGGPGTDDSTAGFHGASGKVGLVGKGGKPGSGGRRGTEGMQGENGQPGGVMWVVLGEKNEVISTSSMKFTVEVLTDCVSLNSAVDDDIFEPSERVSVNGIKILNSGELTLPQGAKFRMVSSDTINFEDVCVALPEIAPGEIYSVTETVYGRIFDIPPPNSRDPFLSYATFNTQVDLFNRSVTKQVPPRTIKVQYPIVIKNVTYPVMQSRGKAVHLKITLQNISQKHYGCSPNSGGYISLVIHLDKRLIPIGYNGNDGNTDYRVYYDPETPDSLSVVVMDLVPNSSLLIDLNIFLDNDADIYDRCLWQVDLLLRQKLIQYKSGYVDVSPGRMTRLEVAPNDVLLVVSLRSLTRLELCFWESILSGMGLNVNYWDMSTYKSFETQVEDGSVDPPTNWSEVFRGQLVVFPHAELKRASVDEIISFFHGPEWKRGVRGDFDSGMFLLMNPSPGDTSRVKLIQTLCMANLSQQNPDHGLTQKQAFHQLKVTRRTSPLFPMCVINPTSMLWERKCTLVKLIFSQNNDVGFTSASNEGRSIFLAELPLSRYVNFCMLDVILPRKENFKFDNPEVEPNFSNLPFGSNLAQTILCVVSAMPTAMKISILMSVHVNRLPCTGWKLVTPSGFILNILDLIYMTLLKDFAKEIKYSRNDYNRFKYFKEKVCSFPTQFTEPSTARCTMGIINSLQNSVRSSLKNRPEVRSFFLRSCAQMEQALREAMDIVTLRSLYLEAEKRNFLNLDLFLDKSVIFSPYEMDSLDGYVH